jgi:hypothetical protein
MIENKNSFNCHNFCAPMPEMVHFPGFAYPGNAFEGPERTLQGLVFDGFSAFVLADRDRRPGSPE